MIRSFLVFLAKRLIFVSLDEALKKVLPLIYNRLDNVFPYLLRKGVSGVDASGSLERIIEDSLGKAPTQWQVLAIKLLYDPIKTIEANYLHNKSVD